jgi:hypothetical protein
MFWWYPEKRTDFHDICICNFKVIWETVIGFLFNCINPQAAFTFVAGNSVIGFGGVRVNIQKCLHFGFHVVLRIDSGSSLGIVSRLGLVMETYCVFCDVWNKFLNIVRTNYRRPILEFRIYIFMHHLIPSPCSRSVAFSYFSNLEILLCSPLHLQLLLEKGPAP